MTTQENIMAEDLDDYSVPEIIVLLSADTHPISKTKFMHRCIERYGRFVEHGPYLFGEYSDDIDEAMERMRSWGLLRSDWTITEFGAGIRERIHNEIDDDEINPILEASQ